VAFIQTSSEPSLAERIKALRKQMGLSVEQFGRLFFASPRTVNGWEQGRRKPGVRCGEQPASQPEGGGSGTSEQTQGDGIRLRAMFQRILDLATDSNFRHFVLVMNSGARYRVRSRDHLFFIRDDNGQPVENWFEVVTGARAFNVPPQAMSSVELEPVIQKA
jgi:hypothetical protein